MIWTDTLYGQRAFQLLESLLVYITHCLLKLARKCVAVRLNTAQVEDIIPQIHQLATVLVQLRILTDYLHVHVSIYIYIL